MTNINLENEGIRLLKKGHKGIMRAIFSRLGLFIVLILVQLGVLFGIFSWFEGVVLLCRSGLQAEPCAVP